jgi:hypothetical protein
MPYLQKRFVRITCATSAWAMLAISAASAQLPQQPQQQQPQQQQPPAATASISGIVTAAGTGEPIAGATVEARRAECGANQTEGIVTAKTGDDGKFTLEKMRAGAWCVGAAHSSGRYTPTEYQQRDYEGRGVALPMVDGQKAEIALAMLSTGGIVGRVVDVDGEPMARVRVEALRVSYRDGQRRLYAMTVIQTDDRGDFRFFWLPADRYYIAAIVEDSDRGRGGYAVPPPGQGGYRTDVVQPVVKKKNLPTGEIVEETYRTIYYGAGPNPAEALPVDVRPGVTVDGVSLSFAGAKTRAYHVRGTVIYTAPPPAPTPPRGAAAAGTPPAQTQPAPAPRPMAQIRIAPREWSPIVTIATATADADGKFDVAGVTPGSYDLYATVQSAVARIPLEVGNSNIDNLRVAPVAGYKVSGRVVIENPAMFSGDFRTLRLQFANDPDIPGLTNSASNATTAQDGTLTITLPQGRYRAYVQPLLSASQLAAPSVPKALENLYLRSIRFGDRDVLADGLSLTGAPEGQLDVVLGTAGSLSGTVATEGSPAINVAVVVVPDFYRNRRDLYRVGRTGFDGKFQIKNVPPGDYRVFAWQDARDGVWYDPEFVRPYEPRGETVHISEGVASTVSLTVITR